MKRIWEDAIRSNHTCTSVELGFVCSPRQICPPALGLSSTTATFKPSLAARHAAASPAGPAPAIKTSQPIFVSLTRDPSCIRAHVHAVLAERLTTAHVRHAVDRHATLEADPHATQWAAWLASHRASKRRRAGCEYCRCHHASGWHTHYHIIDSQCDELTHGQ